MPICYFHVIHSTLRENRCIERMLWNKRIFTQHNAHWRLNQAESITVQSITEAVSTDLCVGQCWILYKSNADILTIQERFTSHQSWFDDFDKAIGHVALQSSNSLLSFICIIVLSCIICYNIYRSSQSIACFHIYRGVLIQ